MKALDQELFDVVYDTLDKAGEVIYHRLPSDEVDYPFYSMGDIQIVPRPSKTHLMGDAFLTVHTWAIERIETSRMCERALYHLDKGIVTNRANFYYTRASYRVLEDNSTNKTLYHGIVECELKFI